MGVRTSTTGLSITLNPVEHPHKGTTGTMDTEWLQIKGLNGRGHLR